MKTKALISLLLTALPFLGLAQKIDDAEAISIASYVLDKNVIKASFDKPFCAPGVNGGAEIVQPFFDIYTGDDGLGFVIVSNDRRAPKVIGYGDGKCNPNNLPPQLKTILAKQDSILHASPGLPQHKSWNSTTPRLNKTQAYGKVLKTANWGQDYPYNLMTPEIDGEHCPTGCVATATAIILKYYGWPHKGYGQYSYEANGMQLNFDYDNTTFNFNDMPLDYVEGQFSDVQANNVATLMKAAGVASYTTYYQDQSGAGLYPYIFYKRFKFFPPMSLYQDGGQLFKSYDDEDFEELIRKEIEEDRLVLYGAGSDTSSNHAFVIDGFGEETVVHINWGWDGYLNGFFDFPYCNGFEKDGFMVFQLVPDEDAADGIEKIFANDGACSGTFRLSYIPGLSLNILGSNLVKDKEYCYYTTDIAAIENLTADTQLALCDKDGNIKEILTDFYKYDTDPNFFEVLNLPGYFDQPCSRNGMYGKFKITKDIDPSDFIQMVYRYNESDPWKFLKAPKYAPARCPVVGNKPYYFNVSIENNVNVKLEVSDKIRQEITASNFKLPAYSTLVIVAKSTEGIPYVTTNDEKGATAYVDDNSGELYVNGAFAACRDFKVKVDLNKYSDMKELVINVNEPETLDQIIPLEDARNVAKLKLSGVLGMSDLSYLYNFVSLVELDLSDASLATGGLPPCQLNALGAMQKLKLPHDLLGIDQIALTAVRFIDLPQTIEYIGWKEHGYHGFNNCPELSEYMVHWQEPLELDEDLHHFYASFNNPSYETKLYVPRGTKEKYAAAPVWKKFDHIIEFDDDYELEKPNEITWTQDLDYVRIPSDIIELKAYSSSGQPVKFRVIDGKENDFYLWSNLNQLVGYNTSNVVIEAFQFSSLFYDAPEPVRKTIHFVKPVMINKENLSMTLGSTDDSLEVTCLDENPENYYVSWALTDPDVVSLDPSLGLITAIGYGKSMIYANVYRKSDDAYLGFGTCEVLVSRPGDANGDGGYTVNDVALVIDHITDYLNEDEEFYDIFADIDGDGEILIPDLTETIELVLNDPVITLAPSPDLMKITESLEPIFIINNVETDCFGAASMDIRIRGGFFSTQFDLILPEDTRLESVDLNGLNDETHLVRYEYIDDNRVRIVVYSMDNSEFPETNFLSLALQCDNDMGGEIVLTRVFADEFDLFGRKSENNYADACAQVIRNNTTGVTMSELCSTEFRYATSTLGVTFPLNGKDGIKSLPAGVYIINNKKVIIR